MFNHNHDQNNYQAVTVNNHLQPSGGTSPVSSLAMFGMFVILLVGLAVVAERALYVLIMGIASIVAGLVTIVPWLVGGGVVVALGIFILRSLPEAIGEVQDIRYRRALAQQSVKMLEVKDVDCIVLDSVPVRAGVK